LRSVLFRIPIPEFLQNLGLPEALPIFSYGLMILLAYIVVTFICIKRAHPLGFNKDIVQDITTSTLIAGIIGARLAHIILYTDQYGSFLEIFKIYNGGLVLYGFLITTPFVIHYKIKKINMSWNQFFLIFLPAIPLGIGIGRLGCFFNGCCFGAPGDLPWCVIFPPESIPGEIFKDIAIHPSQLYAFSLGLILSVLLMKLTTILPSMNGGQMFSSFLLGLGIIRLIEESFRVDTPKHFFSFLTAGQGISVLLMIASLFFFYFSKTQTKT
jgi:phosphatidylglycerol---prolipoprotein diacylglyceryl transferase